MFLSRTQTNLFSDQHELSIFLKVSQLRCESKNHITIYRDYGLCVSNWIDSIRKIEISCVWMRLFQYTNTLWANVVLSPLDKCRQNSFTLTTHVRVQDYEMIKTANIFAFRFCMYLFVCRVNSVKLSNVNLLSFEHELTFEVPSNIE